MRLTSFARRSTAVAAATALLSTGGALSGLLVSPAFADACSGGSNPCVTGVSTPYWDNGSTADLHLSGSNLTGAVSPLPDTDTAPQTVQFILHSTPSLVVTASAETDSTPTSLHVKPNFAAAPPGVYDVRVVRTPLAGGTLTSNTCTAADGCSFTILNVGGAANAASITEGSVLGRLHLTGSNIAHGAAVRFYLDGTSTVDTGLTFTAGNDTGDTASPAGYISTSVLHGSYAQGAFTPGKHNAAIVNTDGDASGARVSFWQPKFAAVDVTPTTMPAGAPAATVTVDGQGFGPGSTLVVSTLSSDATCKAKEVTVTNNLVTTHADGSTTLTAKVAFDACAPAGARSLTVAGPDGGYFTVASALTSTAAPTVTNINSVATYNVGQGASEDVTVNGTNFATGADVAHLPAFNLGTDVIATTKVDAPNNTVSRDPVHLVIAENATVGNRAVRVTNPDGGSSASATTVVNITPGPTVNPNTVDGGGALPGGTTTVTVQGGNFDATNGMDAKIVSGTAPDGSPIDTGWTVGSVTVTKGTPDTARFTVTVPGGTPPGVVDIRLRNLGDKGAVRCVGCFGIDSLGVLDAGSQHPQDTNDGIKTLKLSGQGIAAGDAFELIKVGDPAYQPHLTGTVATSPSGTVSVDLSNAAPGKYGARLVTSGGVLSCISCFTVFGSPVGIGTITPNAAGERALNLPITITAASGKTFARGTQITIATASVHDIVWANPTTLTALVDLGDAAPGAKDVTVTNADGVYSATLSSGFTVNPGPVATTIAPATLGQGAGTQSAGAAETLTVSGTGFAAGATLDLGAGITVVSATVHDGGAPATPLSPEPTDTLTATVKVSPTAATGKRDVVVINPDKGRGTITNGFTVTIGPKVTSVSPLSMQPGTSGQITVHGTGFASGATLSSPAFDGSPTGVTISSDGTTITATVKAVTTLGAAAVAVTNTDKGFGSCACFAVAVAPTVPQGLVLTPGPTSITASWSAPVSTGGVALTGYHLTITRAGLTTATGADVSGSTLNHAFTGLVNGASYSVTVAAVNVAGVSPAASGTGVAGLPASLSEAVSTTKVGYGGRVTVTGKLLGTGGTPLASKTLVLAFYPQVGKAYTKLVTTTATGAWSLGVISPYNVKVKALWAGDASYRPTSSVFRGWTVATRLLRTSPANFSKSRATTVLKITGNAAPNKSGRVLYLQRYLGAGRWSNVASARVSSASTYAFAIKPGRGTYVFRIAIGTTPGNVPGQSATFKLYRV